MDTTQSPIFVDGCMVKQTINDYYVDKAKQLLLGYDVEQDLLNTLSKLIEEQSPLTPGDKNILLNKSTRLLEKLQSENKIFSFDISTLKLFDEIGEYLVIKFVENPDGAIRRFKIKIGF